MKDANDTTNSESSLSRRAVLTSLAAAAVLSGCKSTPEPTPVDDPATRASKAALALWLLFTTRPGFVGISVGPNSTKVTLKGNLPTTLQQDLAGLSASPTATIKALTDYLESPGGHSSQYGPVVSGKPVQLPYAVALQAVQELFQKFGEGKLPGMTANEAPYTGSCCPLAPSNILALATANPVTKDSDYNQCP